MDKRKLVTNNDVIFPDKIQQQIDLIYDQGTMLTILPGDIKWILKQYIVNQPAKSYCFKAIQYTNAIRARTDKGGRFYSYCHHNQVIVKYYDQDFRERESSYDFPIGTTVNLGHCLTDDNFILSYANGWFNLIKINDDYSLTLMSSYSAMNYLIDRYNQSFSCTIDPDEMDYNYDIYDSYQINNTIYVDFGQTEVLVDYTLDGIITNLRNPENEGSTGLPADQNYFIATINQLSASKLFQNGIKHCNLSNKTTSGETIYLELLRKTDQNSLESICSLVVDNDNTFRHGKFFNIDQLSSGQLLIYNYYYAKKYILLTINNGECQAELIRVPHGLISTGHYIAANRQLISFSNKLGSYTCDINGAACNVYDPIY